VTSSGVASLALCFDAPMQSWGIRSRGIIRDTMPEPTKSGVVGVVAAALGIDRNDDAALAEVARLRLAVRVDREGVMERDYHTTQNVPTTQGTGHRTVVSQRYYLADALFLVVLEGDERLLTRVAAAVERPHWRLCFGRKAYVPARPRRYWPNTAGWKSLPKHAHE
jgi:CRISPR system Cascade subunit CasD